MFDGEGGAGLSFATINGDVSERNKCFLIMRFGDRVVVEGSHNFKVRIFSQAQPDCPQLYQAVYQPKRFMRHVVPQYGAFTHDFHGNWKNHVLDKI